MRLLSAAGYRRATLVVAGAGYGKTTALAELDAAGTARWVRLRPADAQAESLSAHVAAALGEAPAPARPGRGAAPARLGYRARDRLRRPHRPGGTTRRDAV
jgi:ATP/maltotriose-dependent transcriptional regulator MalT